ncbi:hypothetical protein LOAG_10537 [Loa loa]|uniref:Uncharacterized protein n=1 Tax=Loa loa TaxID=7209 RepID=A0A1S0TQ98_LOALO|nr:hypothetical protein LOAG_10537 [Loa loa]EFO17962.1 hypothetical protein LOAG_10537 [Loa loa]
MDQNQEQRSQVSAICNVILDVGNRLVLRQNVVNKLLLYRQDHPQGQQCVVSSQQWSTVRFDSVQLRISGSTELNRIEAHC